MESPSGSEGAAAAAGLSVRRPFRPEKRKSGTRVARPWGSSPEHAWVSEGRGETGVWL